MQKVTVAVLTFNNSEAEITRFLAGYRISTETALKKFPGEVTFNLLFSDNGQPSAFRGTEAVEVPSQGNLGFGHGVNKMMEFAFHQTQSDVFITANPDGSFHPDALSALVQAHRLSPNALIEADQFPESNAKGFNPVTLETSWVSGCCLLIPRKIYEAVGGFDEEFFMYMEDIDYSWRAKLAGFKVKICPDALYEHSVMGRKISDSTKKTMLESTRYFGWKWRSKFHYEHCSKTLIEEGLVEPGKLKDLNGKKRVSRFGAWKVSDYTNPWAYGPLRWTNP